MEYLSLRKCALRWHGSHLGTNSLLFTVDLRPKRHSSFSISGKIGTLVGKLSNLLTRHLISWTTITSRGLSKTLKSKMKIVKSSNGQNNYGSASNSSLPERKRSHECQDMALIIPINLLKDVKYSPNFWDIKNGCSEHVVLFFMVFIYIFQFVNNYLSGY